MFLTGQILLLTTIWAHGAIAYAIGVTFLRASDVTWLLPARDANGILTAPSPSPPLMLGPAEVRSRRRPVAGSRPSG